MPKCKIIIADDHEVVINGLVQMLANEDHIEVRGTVRRLMEVIPTVELLKADILLLDINMQEHNSLELLKEIKGKCPRLKVVIFTSFDTPGLRREAAQCGADAFLTKDISRAKLVQTLNYLFDHKPCPDKLIHTANADSEKMQNRFSVEQLLSKREIEILKLVAQGNTSQQVSTQLFISKHTVQWHRKNIISKLGLKSGREMVKFAYDHGLF